MKNQSIENFLFNLLVAGTGIDFEYKQAKKAGARRGRGKF